MKIKTKDRYYFGESLKTIAWELAKFTRDVYDDIRNSSVEILSSLPTPSEDYRGKLVIVPSSGIDELYICRKNGSSYEWKKISLV